MTNETPQTQETQPVRHVINAVIQEQGRKVSVLARKCRINEETLRAKLAGRKPLTDDLARKLAAELHIPASVIDYLSDPPQAA